MQLPELRRVVSTFSDPSTEVLCERNRIVVQVNGELIEETIESRTGDIYILTDGVGIPAAKWVVSRIARLPLLAARISDAIVSDEKYISPSCKILSSLSGSATDSGVINDDAFRSINSLIEDRSPSESSVIYLTSDAGEGKTSLIREVANRQARRFLANETDYLVVPILLGGRAFMRFDDITVGALQNRYRFPFLYYNSFIELVKMGVVVPAFDGFEEMFVESSSGEAMSAMGLLLENLDSRGSLVIATRKAYFEFENFRIQAKFFDAIRTYAVTFSKLELAKWDKARFVEYCQRCKLADAPVVYDKIAERIGGTHSLLTRPVLAKKLVEIAVTSPSIEDFLTQIHSSGPDFFKVFVENIIEREANEKWIDRSASDAHSPLLNVREHMELLGAIAIAMWEAKTDYLKRDHLEFISDYFCEVKQKSAHHSQQIRERIRGHALLVSSINSPNAVEFDHEEFRLFFIGESLAEHFIAFSEKTRLEATSVMRRGALPRHAQRAFTHAVKRCCVERLEVIAKALFDISALEGQASFIHENGGSLALRLLNGVECKDFQVRGIAFSSDCLRDRRLIGLSFNNCYFASTSLETSVLKRCSFKNCTFSGLNVFESTRFESVNFAETRVDTVRFVERDVEFWEPELIVKSLQPLGIQFEVQDDIPELQYEEGPDSGVFGDIDKVMRYFMRSTHISESVIKMKLGIRAQPFIDEIVPQLIENGVLEPIENRGGGSQSRYRLGFSLQSLNATLSRSKRSLEQFFKLLRSK